MDNLDIEIVVLDSYNLIAGYNEARNRIEISEHLDPEFFDFCLFHEVKHRMDNSSKWRSVKAVILDIKDRWKLITDPYWYDKFATHERGVERSPDRWNILEFMIYSFFSPLSQIFIMIIGAPLRWLKRKKDR
jgi:hypothetical protein